MVDLDLMTFDVHGRFRIAANGTVQGHATGANQLASFRSGAVSQLRKRTSQPNSAGVALTHASMLLDERAPLRGWTTHAAAPMIGGDLELLATIS
jgi:hypothetical protein